eukprot:6473355-Amphidinium_carterae.1
MTVVVSTSTTDCSWNAFVHLEFIQLYSCLRSQIPLALHNTTLYNCMKGARGLFLFLSALALGFWGLPAVDSRGELVNDCAVKVSTPLLEAGEINFTCAAEANSRKHAPFLVIDPSQVPQQVVFIPSQAGGSHLLHCGPITVTCAVHKLVALMRAFKDMKLLSTASAQAMMGLCSSLIWMALCVQ